MARHLLAFALALAALSTSTVAAQARTVIPGPSAEPTREDLSRARDLFRRGTEDADAGRWADALAAFEEAYRLSGVAAALFNAATTLRSLGRYRDARDAFDQLLREHPDLAGEMAETAPALREEVARRVAILELRELPRDPELQLRLDGAPREDPGERPLELETDPGRHALRIELPRYEPFLWEGRLRDGERREVTVLLEPLPPPDSGPNVRRIVLWTVIGVLVAGAAVTLGLVLRPDKLQPESDLVVNL